MFTCYVSRTFALPIPLAVTDYKSLEGMSGSGGGCLTTDDSALRTTVRYITTTLPESIRGSGDRCVAAIQPGLGPDL